MKTNMEKISSLHHKINVQVPVTVVQTAFNRIFNSIQKEVSIKGFRKGKAPLTTIRSMYNDRIKQDVAQELIQMHYIKALTEHKLEPISNPEFEFDIPAETKEFSFSATFDVRPEVNLKKYEGFEVEKEKFTFDDKKIDEVLQNIRNSRASFEDVLEVRPAQMGDVAIIDFAGFVDGKPLENGTGTDHNLDLGTKQFIEGFEEGIVGMNVGDSKTLNLKFPNPYHSVELAGKAVEFKVTLKGMKKKVLPELN
ncbi:MAG TPA: trigger factor, partial [Pseudobdellovibrionaceae bacterium]